MVNGKPVQVTPSEFGKYRTIIVDGINAQIKYVYNRAKEKFMDANSRTIKVGKYDVSTNLKGGLSFANNEVEISDPQFHRVLSDLFEDISALMLTYNRPDEFLSMLQTPELWALLPFVAADQELTDTFVQAMLTFFDATWGKSKDYKQVTMRKSIIDMLLTLKKGQPYDLSKLTLYDSQGEPVKLNGTIEPC